jgi:hypothetical protein
MTTLTERDHRVVDYLCQHLNPVPPASELRHNISALLLPETREEYEHLWSELSRNTLTAGERLMLRAMARNSQYRIGEWPFDVYRTALAIHMGEDITPRLLYLTPLNILRLMDYVSREQLYPRILMPPESELARFHQVLMTRPNRKHASASSSRAIHCPLLEHVDHNVFASLVAASAQHPSWFFWVSLEALRRLQIPTGPEFAWMANASFYVQRGERNDTSHERRELRGEASGDRSHSDRREQDGAKRGERDGTSDERARTEPTPRERRAVADETRAALERIPADSGVVRNDTSYDQREASEGYGGLGSLQLGGYGTRVEKRPATNAPELSPLSTRLVPSTLATDYESDRPPVTGGSVGMLRASSGHVVREERERHGVEMSQHYANGTTWANERDEVNRRHAAEMVPYYRIPVPSGRGERNESSEAIRVTTEGRGDTSHERSEGEYQDPGRHVLGDLVGGALARGRAAYDRHEEALPLAYGQGQLVYVDASRTIDPRTRSDGTTYLRDSNTGAYVMIDNRHEVTSSLPRQGVVEDRGRPVDVSRRDPRIDIRETKPHSPYERAWSKRPSPEDTHSSTRRAESRSDSRDVRSRREDELEPGWRSRRHRGSPR